MITSVSKIKTTQEEFDEIEQNSRPSLSEEIHRADRPNTKATFDPSSGEVTEEHI